MSLTVTLIGCAVFAVSVSILPFLTDRERRVFAGPVVLPLWVVGGILVGQFGHAWPFFAFVVVFGLGLILVWEMHDRRVYRDTFLRY